MRSLTELQAAAVVAGIATDGMHRTEIMDALRAATGTFDPALQVDPAKAQDLKSQIDWSAKGVARFAGIASYLTPEWVAQPKLDGARIRAFLGSTANTLNSGRRSDVSFKYLERGHNFPHLRDAVLPEFAGTVLDGELMPPVKSLTTVSGVTTQGTLNSAMALINVNPEAAIATQKKYGKAIFMAFDVLAVKGESVVNLPHTERRKLLEVVLHELNAVEPAFQLIAELEATAANIDTCLAAGFEGAILKRKAGRYLPGKRMSDWVKIKKISTGDFYVIGSVDGKGRNAGKVGSMKVAYRNADGQEVYAADVAGITDAFRNELTGPDGKLDPKFLGTVIEVQAQGTTKNGRLRHPLYLRTRTDKVASECTPACSIELFEQT